MKKTVLKENNSCRMQCIAEENLEQEMDSQVEPFLKQVQICGWMHDPRYGVVKLIYSLVSR